MSRFFFLFLVCFSALFSDNTGSLIVSYQTGPKGERLDRVRFRVTGEKGYSQLYPKGGAVVNNTANHTNLVAIDDLSPGSYSLEFIIPNQDSLFDEILPRTIEIKSEGVTKVDQLIRPRYGSIQATASPEAGSFVEQPLVTIYDQKGNLRAESSVGRLVAHYLVPGTYTVKFGELTGYITPGAKEIAVGPNEKVGPIAGMYVPVAKKRGIPLVKIDQSHSIGTYEVTNKQFARWLNLAAQQKKIYVVDDPAQKGWILNEEGQLLFKCMEADRTSQISLNKLLFFVVVPGKEHHPVIQVTWYGAMAFCQDHGYRLPTEAEWLHAAAESLTEPNRIYLYGFQRDQISPEWANYKVGDAPLKSLAVNTSKVGFYNGKNQLTSGLTKNAVSPVGAYDMSGNVWEWISDEGHNGRRFAKGGCYDSTADGVRVTERISLSADHCDQFTGFRVYK